MPSVGDDARLAFGPDSAEEVDGLMVSVVQSDGYDDVTGADVEVLIKMIGQVELPDGNLATFSTSLSYSPFSEFSISKAVPVPPLSNSTSTPTFQWRLNL